jgi:hypothetical protein
MQVAVHNGRNALKGTLRPKAEKISNDLRRITVFRRVICSTQKQVPRPRSTKIYHSFYYERPQARRVHDLREAAELLEQARLRTSGRFAALL